MDIVNNNIKDFNQINVYTRTLIVSTNIQINIKNFFNDLPITYYKVIDKKKGRKPKSYVKKPPQKVKDNSIIFMKNEQHIRGVNPKDPNNKKNGYFRNSIGMIIFINNKFINVKISQTGKFHLTGCPTKEYALNTMIVIWSYLQKYPSSYYFDSTSVNKFYIAIIPIMCNLNFALNIKIDREALDNYINFNTKYISTLEPDGHTGVNIKVLVDMKNKSNDIIEYYQILENNLYKKIDKNECNVKNINSNKKKETYNTFLVFQSGQVIMSGRDLSLMEDTYYDFIKTLCRSHPVITEKIVM
jgi:hypothetical protein